MYYHFKRGQAKLTWAWKKYICIYIIKCIIQNPSKVTLSPYRLESIKSNIGQFEAKKLLWLHSLPVLIAGLDGLSIIVVLTQDIEWKVGK